MNLGILPTKPLLEMVKLCGKEYKSIESHYWSAPVPFPVYQAGCLYIANQSATMVVRMTTEEMMAEYVSADHKPSQVEYMASCFNNLQKKQDTILTEEGTEQAGVAYPFARDPRSIVKLYKQWDQLEMMTEGFSFKGRAINFELLSDAANLFKLCNIHPIALFYNNGNVMRLYGENEDCLTLDCIIASRAISC